MNRMEQFKEIHYLRNVCVLSLSSASVWYLWNFPETLQCAESGGNPILQILQCRTEFTEVVGASLVFIAH